MIDLLFGGPESLSDFKICWSHPAMTKKTLSAALFLLIALASAAFALDINGKWKGNLASPNGDLETTMVFKETAKS